MDVALVRMLLEGIIEGRPDQFSEIEGAAAVSWLKHRVYLTPRDKGARSQYQPQIESAASATEQALSHWWRGDKGAAKRSAEEALKKLNG